MEKNILSKMIKKYSKFDTVNDLDENNLTLCDYRELSDIFTDLRKNSISFTISENIKNWIIANGGKVIVFGNGWKII